MVRKAINLMTALYLRWGRSIARAFILVSHLACILIAILSHNFASFEGLLAFCITVIATFVWSWGRLEAQGEGGEGATDILDRGGAKPRGIPLDGTQGG